MNNNDPTCQGLETADDDGGSREDTHEDVIGSTSSLGLCKKQNNPINWIDLVHIPGYGYVGQREEARV